MNKQLFACFIIVIGLFTTSCSEDQRYNLEIILTPLSNGLIELRVENIGNAPAYLTQCTSKTISWRVEKEQESGWELVDATVCLRIYTGQQYLLDMNEVLIDTMLLELRHGNGVFRFGTPVSGEYEGEATFEYSSTIQVGLSESLLTTSPVFDADSLDVNQDGIMDYCFDTEVTATTDVPSSGSATYVVMRTLNSNEYGCIPEGCSDTAIPQGFIINEESLRWYPYSTTVASVSWSLSIGWDNEWKVVGYVDFRKYVAIKTILNEHSYFGWIHLEIDRYSGDVKILSYESHPNPGVGIHAGG